MLIKLNFLDKGGKRKFLDNSQTHRTCQLINKIFFTNPTNLNTLCQRLQTQTTDTYQAIKQHDDNIRYKNNTFDNNDISIKINRQSQVQFTGQDFWAACCTKHTLKATNTLKTWIEFFVLLVSFFKQFSSRFENSLTWENWLHQSPIILLSYSASIILSLGLSLCKL